MEILKAFVFGLKKGTYLGIALGSWFFMGAENPRQVEDRIDVVLGVVDVLLGGSNEEY